MVVKLRVDSKEAERYLERLGKDDQLPFAVSKAINAILNLIQSAIRGDMESKITLRKAAWNLRQIKISKSERATKRNLQGSVSLDPAASNLYRLETGADHVPFKGKKYVAIPNVKVFGNKIISGDNPLRVANLQLHKTPQGLRGKERTFMIRDSKGNLMIMQRTTHANNAKNKGKGKNRGSKTETGNRVLYLLERKVKTAKKLDFYGIARKVVEQSWNTELMKAVEYALNTAKNK